MSNLNTRQLPPALDRIFDVPEGDYPDVAAEIIRHVHDHINALRDELYEFLEVRTAAAPTTVNRARALDSVLGYEVRQWLRRTCGE